MPRVISFLQTYRPKGRFFISPQAENKSHFLENYHKENKNSGYIRVTVKDKIIYEKSIGYANIENKIPFTKDSIFSFYSLSKPFCAIGIMKLKEKGLVDIDDHPKKYIPEAEGFDARVTIRLMLHHMSGLPDFMFEGFDKKYKTGYADELRGLLGELSKIPNAFEPGEKVLYENINFTLCAMIIENVTGKKYADYMKEEVFIPFGMKTACVDDETTIVENRVTGYNIVDDKVVPTDRQVSWMFGGGDIIGCADDVYALNKAIKHKLLLKEETWKEILTPMPDHTFGMGCRKTIWHERERITHNGGSDGFRTLHIQLMDDDFDIIMLTNSNWGEMRNHIPEAIYEYYYGNDDLKSDNFKMDEGYIK